MGCAGSKEEPHATGPISPIEQEGLKKGFAEALEKAAQEQADKLEAAKTEVSAATTELKKSNSSKLTKQASTKIAEVEKALDAIDLDKEEPTEDVENVKSAIAEAEVAIEKAKSSNKSAADPALERATSSVAAAKKMVEEVFTKVLEEDK